jgi:hypothetical protein
VLDGSNYPEARAFSDLLVRTSKRERDEEGEGGRGRGREGPALNDRWMEWCFTG